MGETETNADALALAALGWTLGDGARAERLLALTGLTPEALAKDLRYALSKVGEYGRFARGAIVTDKRWLAEISEFAGRFFPNTEIRAFEPEEHDAALAWAASVEPLGR